MLNHLKEFVTNVVTSTGNLGYEMAKILGMIFCFLAATRSRRKTIQESKTILHSRFVAIVGKRFCFSFSSISDESCVIKHKIL